jgi:hypothetical protein
MTTGKGQNADDIRKEPDKPLSHASVYLNLILKAKAKVKVKAKRL